MSTNESSGIHTPRAYAEHECCEYSGCEWIGAVNGALGDLRGRRCSCGSWRWAMSFDYGDPDHRPWARRDEAVVAHEIHVQDVLRLTAVPVATRVVA